MSEMNAQRIAELTITALERTAFVLAEPAEDDADLPPASHFARIEYTGPVHGHVYIAASDGFVRELASSLLGVESDEIDPAQCEDALRELANIIGGSVILELGGTDRLLSLGLPENVKESDVPALTDQSQLCCLDSECERLDVIWLPAQNQTKAAA